MSAYRKVRVAAGCGRPSAVKTRGATRCLGHEGLEFPFGNGMLFVEKRLALHLLELLLHRTTPQPRCVQGQQR